MTSTPAKPATPLAPAKTVTATVTKAAAVAPAKPAPVPAFGISSMQEDNKWLKAIFYGIHGAGKTVLSGTAVDVAEMRDVAMMNCEKGALSIQESPLIKNADLIDIFRCDNIVAVDQIVNFLKSYCQYRDTSNKDAMLALQRQIRGPNYNGREDGSVPEYRTLIVDSLTEVEAFSMYQTLGISENTSIAAEAPTQEWSHYRTNLNRIQLIARKLRTLPMNIIFLCQESWTQDETKQFHYGPALAGKLGSQIQGFVDIVGYLQSQKPQGTEVDGKRRLWIQPVGKFSAKNRRGSFKEAYIEDPSMTKLMAGIAGAKV